MKKIYTNKDVERITVDGISYNHDYKEEIIKHQIKDDDSPADFETAINATGFGCFNVWLLLTALPCMWASGFDSSSISYILPAAECDLNLTPFKKGLLNAITYSGMITSAFMWGFLTDLLGRKKLLIIGFLLSGFFDFMCAFSFDFHYLLIFKYANGFCICGPYAAFMTYLSELHCAQHRARAMLSTGIWFSLGNVTIPYLAWLIIPVNIELVLIEGYLVFHSWNVFLAVLCLPGLISAVAISFLPESPKFLMSKGRNKEAMEVFQKVYSMNTGMPPETFPIKVLVNEQLKTLPDITHLDGNSINANNINQNKSALKTFLKELRQVRPLFQKPYVFHVLLIFTMQISGMLGTNTLRLWLPQLFTIVDNYALSHVNHSATICEMLDQSNLGSSSNQTVVYDSECYLETLVNPDAYLKSVVVGITQGSLYLIAGGVVNFFGKKNMLVVLFTTAGAAGISIYWTKDVIALLGLSAFFISSSSVCITLVVQVATSVVPTNLRTITVSLAMMFGRTGALFGNLIFPLLIAQGCLPPFLFIGMGTLTCGLMSILLPNTDLKPLK